MTRLLAVIVASLVCGSAVQGDQLSSFVTVDYPGAYATWVEGLNDVGQLVGHYDCAGCGGPRGFSVTLSADEHHGGVFHSFTVPGAWGTYPQGINNHGHIVGYAQSSGGVNQGFLLDHGVFTSIVYPGAVATQAVGINDSGDIVGSWLDSSYISHGFLLRGGVYTSIEYPGARETGASAIDSSGKILGVSIFYPYAARWFFLTSAGFQTNSDYPGTSNLHVTDINDGGVAVGYAYAGPLISFIWRNGTFTRLECPFAVSQIAAVGINNHGQVSGQYNLDGHAHGFVANGPTFDMTGPITSDVAVTPSPVPLNAGSILTAAVSDAGTGNANVISASYAINGVPQGEMTFSPVASATVQANVALPPFTQSGVYDICVAGTDLAANTGQASCVLVPVYDPSAGQLVTGHGSIYSSPGKDRVAQNAAGPAEFGFVTKYASGATVPSGNLEFRFRAGNLDFKSTTIEWLVVTGERRAKFQGTGLVNDTTACKFQADAWDGAFTDCYGAATDAFGLRIYGCDSGGDANGNRYSIDAVPLTRGNVVIHK